MQVKQSITVALYIHGLFYEFVDINLAIEEAMIRFPELRLILAPGQLTVVLMSCR